MQGKCENCKDSFKTFRPLMSNFDKHAFCDWCAFIVNSDDWFIKARTSPLDKEILAAQLGIFRPDTFECVPSSEIEWWTDVKPGENIDRKWKDYVVIKTGFVSDDLMERDPLPLLSLRHPDDPQKRVDLCRLRVFHKYSVSYLEFVFKFHTLSISGYSHSFAHDFAALKKSIPLIFQVAQGKTGRKKDSGTLKKSKLWMAVEDVLKAMKQMKPMPVPLSQAEVLSRLTSHPLSKTYNKDEAISVETARNRKRTLTRWLEGIGKSWADVKKMYNDLPPGGQ
jgi:hypothetical protein